MECSIRSGDEVTEEQLKHLIGHGAHPVTGEPLGCRYRTFGPPAEGKRRHAVAGYDLTFSIPKSASVLWGVADAGTQTLIARAHHAAVADALNFLEREVIATRVGAKGPKGAVAQVEVAGVIATGFDHYDSRANDPHLHTHVVISNKVKTLRDGRWRAPGRHAPARLGGRPLGAPRGIVQRPPHSYARRGMGAPLARAATATRPWEINGVPQSLVQAFSSRARDIDATTDHLIEGYVERHGRRPGRATIMKLRQQANLSKRPAKHIHSLADLTDRWRRQTSEHLGEDAVARGRARDRQPAEAAAARRRHPPRPDRGHRPPRRLHRR
ncbi:MobF family relaxase [Nocardioides sp. B-3]|uniref:MobF family relaxase n=1 Tax=Nocardioides sp. B-3 TaxID=2895565 RepID=UPI00215251D6|nr:MobF family relaxase [Nocardioides sp. B-3]